MLETRQSCQLVFENVLTRSMTLRHTDRAEYILEMLSGCLASGSGGCGEN